MLLRSIEAKRRAAEQHRLESEEHLRLAVTDAPVPMVIHDEQDRILHMSRGWAETSGHSLADTPTIADWTSRAQSSMRFEVKRMDKLAGSRTTVYGGEGTITERNGERHAWDFSTSAARTAGNAGPDVPDDRARRPIANARRGRPAPDDEISSSASPNAHSDAQANDVLRRQSDQLKEQAALLDLVREGIIVRDPTARSSTGARAQQRCTDGRERKRSARSRTSC